MPASMSPWVCHTLVSKSSRRGLVVMGQTYVTEGPVVRIASSKDEVLAVNVEVFSVDRHETLSGGAACCEGQDQGRSVSEHCAEGLVNLS